jgi:hypothetical protein
MYPNPALGLGTLKFVGVWRSARVVMGLLLGTPYCYQTAVLRLASSNLVFFNRWFLPLPPFWRGPHTSNNDELNRQSSITSTTTTSTFTALFAYGM